MGAGSSCRCSSWPREGDRGGEVRVLSPVFFVEGGAAAAPSLLFFTEDAGLIIRG